ncbi:hypothetical protein [Stieleria neptunia]|nr:hypothetical protein [Stieleria neptunia]
MPPFIPLLLATLFVTTTTTFSFAADLGLWNKHVVTEQGHCNTATATQGPWTARPIDNEITGIHCLLRSDIDNDGLGTFAQHTVDTGQQSYDLRSVDTDGDGDADLLNAGRGSNNVVWYENPLKCDDLRAPWQRLPCSRSSFERQTSVSAMSRA